MATKTQSKTQSKTKNRTRSRTARTAPAPAKGRSSRPDRARAPDPAPEDDEDDVLNADDDDGARDDEDQDRPAGEDDAMASTDARQAAAARIGCLLYAHLEVLHMADRDGAVETIERIVPVVDDLRELAADLKTVGAGALARDVRLAVDRQDRRRGPR